MGNEGVAAPTAFEVAIGPGDRTGRFSVEVVRSPAGEASASVDLDLAGLLGRRQDLQNALIASAVPARRLLPEIERPIREVGRALFAALLGTGEVGRRYAATAALAARAGQGLRLVLRIDTPELAGLPWEAMYDDSSGAYVCLQEQLVRHVPIPAVPAPLAVDPPLRVLGVISAPLGLPWLDAGKERDQLTRALARPVQAGLVEVGWTQSATWAELHDLLLGEQWHVLHFIGHGDFDFRQDEGLLALTGEDGRPDFVEAHRFAALLRRARPMPRLVVLNSCAGAATGSTDLFSGTAAALVRGGVSAVAAMQYSISDAAVLRSRAGSTRRSRTAVTSTTRCRMGGLPSSGPAVGRWSGLRRCCICAGTRPSCFRCLGLGWAAPGSIIWLVRPGGPGLLMARGRGCEHRHSQCRPGLSAPSPATPARYTTPRSAPTAPSWPPQAGTRPSGSGTPPTAPPSAPSPATPTR